MERSSGAGPQRSDTVVVAVNESASSQAAIRYGAHLARRDGGRVMLAHVVPQAVRTGGLYAIMPDYFEANSEQLLGDAAREAERLLEPAAVSTELLHGTVVTNLLRAAGYASAIVLGSDLRPARERFAGGSTIAGVATRCPVPVFVVPPTWTGPATHPQVTLTVRDIGAAEPLVRTGFALAAQHGGRLRVAHASGLPTADRDPAAPGVHADPPSVHLAEVLRATVEAVRADHPDVECQVQIVHGPAARVLATLSQTSDLLVLERRQHLHGERLGRTAKALLRTSGCPVLVLPPVPQPGAQAPGRSTASAEA